MVTPVSKPEAAKTRGLLPVLALIGTFFLLLGIGMVRLMRMDPLCTARFEYVSDHNEVVMRTARSLGYEVGYGEEGKCELGGPEDTTLTCGELWRSLAEERDDLCGRGFKKVVIGGSEHVLDCTGIKPDHLETNKYGRQVWRLD